MLILCFFMFFIGRYYYNNSYEMYEYEKSKKNNFWNRFLLKLNTPKTIKFMGIAMIILSIIISTSLLVKILSFLMVC